ncbi:ABC transporter permease [Actibacterium sp. 188UL27-1]|uniref:ABC transporter permease n=1 Tax=Actibacterium sp. 188UL27-1 TaxID=2786961 RepID=UPI00195EE561|nr:ABC transporter permease [Actibacterium sp. 188UL27-1]MBM7067210.1 ABC transporter permease [Actibacterium sp. 188UL27-1]
MAPSSKPRRRFDGFATFWGAPALIWQTAFFLVPLGLLVAMTFWAVKSYRLTPDFTARNWERMFTRDYFWTGYLYTFELAALVAVLASVIAFPAAHYLAFRASPRARRIAIFLLVTPFFTSYLVRIYSWKIILSTEGVLNVMFGWLGLGPFEMLNNAFGATIGYLTLCLPLTVMIQYFALSNIDRSLIGAAHNLGCGPLRTTVSVTIPAAKIGLILAATFAFILTFGDYVSPAYLGGGTPPTLSILIVDQTKSGNHWPRASVVAVTMVFTLITVLFAALFAAYGRPGAKK